MRRMSAAAAYPTCHLGSVPGPERAGACNRISVWICEYPYRTMRSKGPSSDCGECPVWQAMERARGHEVPASPQDESQSEFVHLQVH